MSATAAEVLRSLPPELGAGEGMSQLSGSEGTRRWSVELTPRPARRVGAIDLPVTELSIRLSGYTEDERSRFMERLEACTRRGGG